MIEDEEKQDETKAKAKEGVVISACVGFEDLMSNLAKRTRVPLLQVLLHNSKDTDGLHSATATTNT